MTAEQPRPRPGVSLTRTPTRRWPFVLAGLAVVVIAGSVALARQTSRYPERLGTIDGMAVYAPLEPPIEDRRPLGSGGEVIRWADGVLTVSYTGMPVQDRSCRSYATEPKAEQMDERWVLVVDTGRPVAPLAERLTSWWATTSCKALGIILAVSTAAIPPEVTLHWPSGEPVRVVGRAEPYPLP